MSDSSVVVARPPSPARLVLLFHGVGASAATLMPLAQLVAQQCADAMVVSVDGAHASTLGSGREWFSVVGVTEANRPQRIAQALPQFRDAIARWQGTAGIGAAATTLVGFSQGAIMALESTQDEVPPPASLVIALAGRFAVPARRAAAGVRYRFIHGSADGVIPARFSAEAAHALQQMGADARVDVVAGLGHGIDARAARLVLAHLA